MGPGGGGASTSADPVDDAQQRFRSSVLGAHSSRSKSLGLSRFDAVTPLRGGQPRIVPRPRFGDAGGHANALIFDVEKRVIERFEPHGRDLVRGGKRRN